MSVALSGLTPPSSPPPLPLEQVTQLVSRGQWSSGELKDGLELAMGGCAQLDAAARQCLREAAAAAAAKQAADDGGGAAAQPTAT